MSSRRDEMQAIHGRVLEGDPSAPAALLEAIHRPIVGVLMKYFGRRGLKASDAGDLATDAVLEYLRSPHKFDSSRASLFTFLATIAKGDALNRLASLRRDREGARRFVELRQAAGNIENAEPDILIDAERILAEFGAELVDDETDAAVLKLMILGEKNTDAYAVVLGLERSPVAERALAVKQRRDKMEKRLRRLRDRL